MALNEFGELSKCMGSTNCIRVEWFFPKLNDAYDELIEFASGLPRVKVLEKDKDYWHGVVRSLIFRFPDDLEILRIRSRNIIQVRSASRLGLSDLGVNQQRIEKLYSNLKRKNINASIK